MLSNIWGHAAMTATMKTLLVLSTLMLAFVANAQVHPDRRWRTLSMEHFELIYDAENQRLAEIYAERLKSMTLPFVDGWMTIPPKTVLVLNDRTDLTNGYATFLPYPLVMIFPVVPGPMESIGEYHDWAWEISAHEYVHILEFSQRRGLVWGLSYIFGSIMTPNALLPRWSLEGAAVEAETRFSKGGRLRSKMQAGTLRALQLAGRLESLRQAEINEFAIPTYPFGARPYLFGSLLWADWIHTYGDKATRELHHNTGGRIPYLLDGAFEPVFEGQGPVELFYKTKNKMVNAAQAEIETLAATPLTAGTKVDPEMFESLSPSMSPDGLKLAYIAKNAALRRRVQVLVRPTAETAFDPSHRIQWFGREFDQSMPSGSPIPRASGDLVGDVSRARHGDDGNDHGGGDDDSPGGNINRISWHPGSNSFIFDQVLERNRFQEMSDIWSFDLGSGKATRITTEARAREPAYSPDASKIALVQIVPGRTDLAIYEIGSKILKQVYESPTQGRVSFPVWLDQNTVLFSVRSEGREQVLRLNILTGTTEKVLAEWLDPQFLSVEKNQLLFTSTKNGVRNLYRADLNLQNVRPVTHSASHVLGSTYDAHLKRYYYTEITDESFQLKSIPDTEVTRLPATLPVVGSYWGDQFKGYELPFMTGVSADSSAVAAGAKPAPGLLTASSEEYSAWPYMYPRYWLPFVAWDDRGTYLTIQTSANDPLGKHRYSVQGTYDSAIKRGSYIFGYQNQSYWPLISLTSYDYSLQLATPGEYSRAQLNQLIVSWELEHYSPDWFVGVGANTGSREKFGLSSRRVSPLLSTTYRNAFQNGNQISPEFGWLGSLQLSAPRDLDANRTFAVAEASGAYYFSKWLPKRHAIMIKGQARTSDELLQVEYMEQSVAYASTTNTPFAEYLNRGYPSGTFLGRNIVGTTLEYRFPVGRLDAGPDGLPIYVHRWHGAIVADGIFVDGFVYNYKAKPETYFRTDSPRGFWSYGAELRFDMNVGFHIPLTMGVGVYAPADTRFVEGGPRLGTFLVL